MDDRIDLNAARRLIDARRPEWVRLGIKASDTTWRDQGGGWPPPLVTDRAEAKDPDSIGVSLRKGAQGSVVLFKGGWADLLYWDGVSDAVIDEAPGYDDWLDLPRFAGVRDRLTAAFG